MKYLLVTLLVGLSVATWAAGGETGGGDACERRFKEVRDDIRKWAKDGGPRNGLNLGDKISTDEYVIKMIDAIDLASVTCVKPGDAGHPVTVNGRPKVCKFEKSQNSLAMTCDYDAFLNKTSEEEQYRKVHHEYASALGFEKPNGADSDYWISNQLTDYLETKTLKRLAIRKVESQKVAVMPSTCSCVVGEGMCTELFCYDTLEVKIWYQNPTTGQFVGQNLISTRIDSTDYPEYVCEKQLQQLSNICTNAKPPEPSKKKSEKSGRNIQESGRR